MIKKYKMKSGIDYRPNMTEHNVSLIHRVNNEDWAFGEFAIIDDDMIDATEEEIKLIPKKEIPKITSRQCKEMLIVTGRYDNVLAILDGLPETTEEERIQKLVLKNYWDNSQEFIRDHAYMELIISALGMSSDDADTFFILASKR